MDEIYVTYVDDDHVDNHDYDDTTDDHHGNNNGLAWSGPVRPGSGPGPARVRPGPGPTWRGSHHGALYYTVMILISAKIVSYWRKKKCPCEIKNCGI